MRNFFRRLQRAPFQPISAFIGILASLIGIASALLLPFWPSNVVLVLITLIILIALWHRFPLAKQLPAGISRALWVLLILSVEISILWSPMQSKYSKDYPPTSLVYVVPAFWSPPEKWFMTLRHCGPEPIYNLDVYFADNDRRQQLIGRPAITPKEIGESEFSMKVSEVDPTENTPMFSWSPLNPDQASYTVRITARGSVVDETLHIRRAAGKWYYQMSVSEVTNSGRTKIIDCADAMSSSDPTTGIPACFPHYVTGPHQHSC